MSTILVVLTDQPLTTTCHDGLFHLDYFRYLKVTVLTLLVSSWTVPSVGILDCLSGSLCRKITINTFKIAVISKSLQLLVRGHSMYIRNFQLIANDFHESYSSVPQ